MSRFLGLASSSRALTSSRPISNSCQRALHVSQRRVDASSAARWAPTASQFSFATRGILSRLTPRPQHMVVRAAHSDAAPLPTQKPSGKTRFKSDRTRRNRRRLLILLGLYLSISFAAYHLHAPSRHLFLALTRCARLMKAVVLDVIDYKRTFAMAYDLEAPGEVGDVERERRRQDRKKCHKRSAERMLEALKKNSGIYVVSV
jgi:aarF domain-containing kinase